MSDRMELVTNTYTSVGVLCLLPVAVHDGVGQAVWDFLCEVVCEDLCQADDPPLVLQEQNLLLVQALAVLSALYACPDHSHRKADTCEIPAFFLRMPINVHYLQKRLGYAIRELLAYVDSRCSHDVIDRLSTRS